MKNNQFMFEFTWPDAWVLTSLYTSHSNGSPFDLASLIEKGNAYDHVVTELDELNRSFYRLAKCGIVEFKGGRVYYSRLARKIIRKSRFKSGELRFRFDLVFEAMNSCASEIAENSTGTKIIIVTEAQFQEARQESSNRLTERKKRNKHKRV